MRLPTVVDMRISVHKNKTPGSADHWGLERYSLQLMLLELAAYAVELAAYGVTHKAFFILPVVNQPQVPTAPQAVQKSQPSLRIIV